MVVGSLDKPMLKLFPKQLIMKQDGDLALFQIIDWNLLYRETKSPDEGIQLVIVMRRKILSEIMSTYLAHNGGNHNDLASILLMFITFATTFVKPFFFEAALTVNLTNMLVMTTIFISVMEKLPITSYPKMVDFWLIFCQLVPFTEVRLIPFQFPR